MATSKKTTDKSESKEPEKTGVVGGVTRLVDKYGPMAVSIATLVIAIVFCLWFTTSQIKWMQKQVENRQTEIVQVIQTTVKEEVKVALDQREEEHNKNAARRIELGPRINADLKKALVEVGCDDIIVCEYHNGYTNIATNLPFCRYSVTYEAARIGFTQIAADFQSLSISPLITMLEPGKVSVFTQQDAKDLDGYIYYFMNRELVKELYACPIMYNGTPCGVVVAIVIKDHEVNQDKLVQLAKEMSTYLHKD
jgi:hypothetical protein